MKSTGFPVIDKIVEDDDNPAKALDVFRNRRITAEYLARTCRGMGYDISASTIRTYRREYEAKEKK